MDRLEKALEKARAQRAATGADFHPHGRASAAAPSVPIAALTPHSMTKADLVHLERHRVLAHRTRSREADIFRILRTQVLQIMQQQGFRTLAITSPNYGDGKTTTAFNLGLSVALDLKQTVLLSDLDLRKPSLHAFLHIQPAIGLSDYLLDNVALPQCLVRLSDRLSILPGGRRVPNSSEVLGSPRMAALAEEIKTRYRDRMVIYDLPPVLAQDDPNAFLPHVDAVLVVIRDGVTRAPEVKQCLARLSGANVIGTVLNDAVKPRIFF